MMQRPVVFMALAPILWGCAVGPDFKAPPARMVDRITADPLPARLQGGQPTIAPSDAPSEWWTLFGSVTLNNLVREALSANPDLAAARAALRVAQANADAQRAAFFPGLSGGFDATRQKTSNTLSPVLSNPSQTFNLFTPQLTVSYSLDLFGGTRRATESADAAARAQLFTLRAARLTLAGNVALAAIQYASLSDQIVAQRSIVTDTSQLRDLIADQLARGAVSEVSLAAQDTLVLQQKATLIGLEKQQAQQRDLLAALTGRLPAQFASPDLGLSDFSTVHDIPVSLPADLVRQRPDVRIAEENLHTANAQVGVAIAAMLPSITLSGSNGSAASALGALFGPGNGFWNVGAGLLQPLFDGGALLAKKRAADAALQQVEAQYQSAVVMAFQNTADALEAAQFDAKALSTIVAQERAAKISLSRSGRQRELGDVGLPSLLLAQQAYQQAEISLAQAKASQLADTVGLFTALGGGWWHGEKEGEGYK